MSGQRLQTRLAYDTWASEGSYDFGIQNIVLVTSAQWSLGLVLPTLFTKRPNSFGKIFPGGSVLPANI